MKNIVIIGGGGHAKVVISILRKLRTYNIIGYTDIKNNGSIIDVPFIGTDDKFLLEEKDIRNAAIGIGQIQNGKVRRKIINKFIKNKFFFPPIVSKNAIINENVVIGKGTVVMDGVVINVDTKIGKYSIINTNSTVEHDCNIGSFTHIAPGATLSGEVNIGSDVLIGTGANVIQNISIVNKTLISAGSLVLKDINESGIYRGVPAKLIKSFGK
jgi:sugar O-acyltransferase (sialic acid O-acetyltransferase NeuD family)